MMASEEVKKRFQEGLSKHILGYDGGFKDGWNSALEKIKDEFKSSEPITKLLIVGACNKFLLLEATE